MQYNICPYCGANLDPGERCDCQDDEEDAKERKLKNESEKEKTIW